MLDVCKAHRGTFPGKPYLGVHIGPPSISPSQVPCSFPPPSREWVVQSAPPTLVLGSYEELAPGNATEQRLSI